MRAAITIVAVVLTAFSVSGCASLWDYSPRTQAEDDADFQRTQSSYKRLASTHLKDLKYAGGLTAPTISPLRKAHTVAFADWMACVQGEETGIRRTFAVFYREGKIADFRHAVVIDRCEAERYERLEADVASSAPAQPVSVKP
jgi:hypothetical protein